MLHQRQTKARAALVAGDEAVKTRRPLVGLKARAIVAHAERNHVAHALGRHHNLPARLGKAQRVGDEVEQHLLDPALVAPHLAQTPGDLGTDGHFGVLRLRDDQFDALMDHLFQVHLAELQIQPPGLDQRQVENVLDQLVEMVGG